MRASAYRTNASELRDHEVAEDAREIEAVTKSARTRRTRAIALVSAVCFGLGALPLVMGWTHHVSHRPVFHCHKVKIQRENQPGVPPDTYPWCEWR